MAIFINLNIKLCWEGINDRRTNPVQSTRDLITASAKFTTSVKYRKDSFNCRTACFLLDIDWNTTTIIDNRDRIVRLNKDLNMSGETSQGLIDWVIDNLPYQMMQPFFWGWSNIHTWAHTYRFKTL